MVWWIILGIVLALILVLLVVPIKLDAHFIKNSVTNELTVILKYMGIKFVLYPKKKTKKPDTVDAAEVTKPDEKSESKKKEDADEQPEDSDGENSIKSMLKLSFKQQKEQLESYIKIFNDIKEDIAKVLDFLTSRAVVINLIDINVDFGLENAMYTGIFTGLLNGFVYSVLGFIDNHSNLKKMKVFIQPEFGKNCFETEIKCICRLKNVHIIIIVINVLKILRKIKKTEGSK